eukprot:CAMPEP_0183293530 /NCGR_PEP_ID=MMETSP0160_2-20130417/2180_1 /TAXON_ID=2839 ORGANISM="Odontella Sinensis, Strain Grunow 1884" /NCGR_SAMPLE_ID=MMETSP0160_2 /ASSEMBLY_ACC=CAM_ASM_000250 /LENGTH=220 /DNA_ID=CAMNT_0025454661 /DNA_START=52 /DNA_END=714 /DNA_ORIENTATION=+
MKLSLLILSAASVKGFVPSASFRSASTSLNGARVDPSEAIAAALEASEKFGSTSTQARTAWEVVEEMDSSDNSVAYMPFDEAEFDAKMSELAALIGAQKSQITRVKQLAREVRDIKVSSSAKVEVGPTRTTPAMTEALNEAARVTKKYGVESPQARMAWEAVEEIASNDLSEATKPALREEECLVNAIDACEALEELNDVLEETGRFNRVIGKPFFAGEP